MNTRRELILLIALFAFVIVIGILFYHKVENLRFIDAIYMTSITLTTVGYGDHVPQTDIGKLFTSIYAFVGVGFFFGFSHAIFQNTINYSRKHTGQNNTSDHFPS